MWHLKIGGRDAWARSAAAGHAAEVMHLASGHLCPGAYQTMYHPIAHLQRGFLILPWMCRRSEITSAARGASTKSPSSCCLRLCGHMLCWAATTDAWSTASCSASCTRSRIAQPQSSLRLTLVRSSSSSWSAFCWATCPYNVQPMLSLALLPLAIAPIPCMNVSYCLATASFCPCSHHLQSDHETR